jgi:cell division control protein 6
MGGKMHKRGHSMTELYEKFFELVDSEKQIVLVVLDEIDILAEKGSYQFFYTLTRAETELKNASLSIIGITNRVSLINALDGRLRSSLAQEEILFPPYNAVQLQDILKQRSKIAFMDNVLDKGVIEKCSALGSQEHGDARKSLKLMDTAGWIAEWNGSAKVKEEHVDVAQEKLDIDIIINSIKSQPRQVQLVILSLLNLVEKGKKKITTGDVHSEYENLAKETFLTPVSLERLSNIITELDSYGIIKSTVTSFGRYGRTKIIDIPWSEKVRKKSRTLLMSFIYGG